MTECIEIIMYSQWLWQAHGEDLKQTVFHLYWILKVYGFDGKESFMSKNVIDN